MKHFNVLKLFILVFAIAFTSCNDSKKATKKDAVEPAEVTKTPATPITPQTNASQTATGQMFHYTCSKGCAGGAGSAVNCSTCGSLLVHNAAFHNNNNNNTNSAPFAGPFADQPNQSTSNKVGVFHYTCGNGCAGGSGSAGNCATCGAALAHNAAYHN